MATYLYRLGRFAARRAWAVVTAWVLVLALLGGGAATLMKPFTSEMTIPNTEFQTVLDDLKRSLPAAAGGMGTVVFRTEKGAPFTDAQKAAIAAANKTWSDIDGVDVARDPFETQASIDDGASKLTDGEAKLAEGEKQLSDSAAQIAAGKEQIKAGEAEIAQNQKKLDDAQAQLDASLPQLQDGQAQYDAGWAQYQAGYQQYQAGEAQYQAGLQQYQAGLAQWEQGNQQYQAGEAQYQAGLQQYQAGEAQYADGMARYEAGQQQLAAGQTQLAQLTQQLGADAPEVAALRAQLEQSAQELAAAKAQLDASRPQLDAAKAQLDASRPQLDAAKAQLDQSRAPLDSAKAQLDASRRQLDGVAAQLAQGRQQLDASKAQLDDGWAQYNAGQAQIDAGRQQLEAGKAQLEASKAQLAEGEKKLAEGRQQLADARSGIAQGRRQVELTKGLRFVNERGDVALGQIMFDKPINEISQETTTGLSASPELTKLADAGVVVDFSREITANYSTIVGPGEVVGLAIAGVVLLVMLGSLLAAGMPLLTALVGVGTGLLAALMVTHWVQMTSVTPALALMLGLAVGIDYSLFIVNRHREQLAHGVELQESIGRATGTAGSAVVFAGLTVFIALAALGLTGIPFLGIMGLVAAGTVAAAVLVSVTLTPALLRLVGSKVLSRRARRQLAAADAAEADETGSATVVDETAVTGAAAGAAEGAHAATPAKGWGGLVTRHPWVTLALATVLLAGLAFPALSLRLGLPDAGSEPKTSSAYRNYTAVADNFGPGANGPIIAVAKVPEGRAASLTDVQVTDLSLDVAEQLRTTQGVRYVVPIGHSDDRQTLAFQMVPETGPGEEATVDLVKALRSDAKAVVADHGLTSVGFSGQTVANIDISKALGAALPVYLGVVVGISLLLLLLVFRSVVVPVIATGGFLLSVAAAFGAVVAVYQWGHLAPLFGVEHPGPVLSFLPTIVIGVLFGLAMDYQMFLVTGMREGWSHGQDARTAVRTGFRHGARVVTAAALIMAAVFSGFIHAELAMIRPIGFALAIGVLLDAFVTRMTATPAIMHLLGEKAWWMPAWLDRILPDLDVEGTTLVQAREAEERATLGA